MNQTILPRNEKGIRAQVVSSGLSMLGLNLIVTLLFRYITPINTRIENIALVTMWAVLLFGWGFYAIFGWRKLTKETYILGDESLIIQKNSTFGRSSKLYRYDSIKSVTVDVGYLGTRYGYGTVRVHIPPQDDVVLTYVDNPDGLAGLLKQAASKQSSSVQVSVSK